MADLMQQIERLAVALERLETAIITRDRYLQQDYEARIAAVRAEADTATTRVDGAIERLSAVLDR